MVSYNHSSKIILVDDAKYIYVLPSFSTSSSFFILQVFIQVFIQIQSNFRYFAVNVD